MTKKRQTRSCCWCAPKHTKHEKVCHYHDRCWRDMTEQVRLYQLEPLPLPYLWKNFKQETEYLVQDGM